MKAAFTKHAKEAARIAANAVRDMQAECDRAAPAGERSALTIMMFTVTVDALGHSLLQNAHLLPADMQPSPEYREALERLLATSWSGGAS